MQLISLQLPQIRGRTEYLEAMPLLRDFTIQQARQLPQAKGDVLGQLSEQLTLLPDMNDLDLTVQVLGYIDTEKEPYKKFWEKVSETVTIYDMLRQDYLEHVSEAEKVTTGDSKENKVEISVSITSHIVLQAITVLSTAISTYTIGQRIYHAARDACIKKVSGADLGRYWDKIKL